MQFIAYTICGAIAGVCGYLWVARFAVAYTDIALGFELSVIAACLIGGVAIAGGIGSAVGVVLGCLFIGIIRSSLPLVGISAFWQMFINGVVILVAVLLSARQREYKRTILEAASHEAGESCFAGNRCWPLVLVLEFIVFSAISPYFLSVDTLSDATFNFTERAIVALAAGAADHRRRDRHFGRRHHCARVRGHGAGVGAGHGHRRHCRRGPGHRIAGRLHQRRAGDDRARAVHRRHHRHHDAVPRRRVCGARRSRAQGLPGVVRGIRPGLFRRARVHRTGAVRALRPIVRRVSASHALGPRRSSPSARIRWRAALRESR